MNRARITLALSCNTDFALEINTKLNKITKT